ncbi:hypothetical protein [Nocardioides convexus]|uniref:hypothetical protein n=1 Tax=Nocardioides convexus TaxID=2712224 RepID=UPI0024189625|nr:hypothetical protein [Nocardioides convexus]
MTTDVRTLRERAGLTQQQTGRPVRGRAAEHRGVRERHASSVPEDAGAARRRGASATLARAQGAPGSHLRHRDPPPRPRGEGVRLGGPW